MSPSMDGRRTQWIAWDVMFFSGDFGLGLIERFGTTGVVVWIAYLSACKRNLVPGQITVGGDADTMAQLGLVGVPLADLDGNEWDLETFWTHLGRLKNVSRTRRGRTTNVICTHWERWQQDARRFKEAERKGRSRAGNSGTKAGRSTDDIGTETDQDNDNDNDHLSGVPLELVDAMARERDPRVVAAVQAIVDARMVGRDVGDPPSYRKAIVRQVTRDDGPALDALAAEHPDLPAQALVGAYAADQFLSGAPVTFLDPDAERERIEALADLDDVPVGDMTEALAKLAQLRGESA